MSLKRPNPVQRLVIPVASLWLVACGGKTLNEATPDASGAGGAGGGQDAAVVTDDAGAGGDGGAGGEGGAGGGPVTPLTPYPGGCTADDDCPDRCVQGICITPPPSERNARYSCDNELVPDSVPALDCWARSPRPPAGPARVRLFGKVIYFGEGVQTIDLTVRLYDFETFDPTPCLDAAAGVLDLVVARERTEACLDEETTPLATTTTVECDPPDPESACYTLADVPTNRPLVARVTGDLEQWVPTYSFGVFVDACDAPARREEAGTCPEQVSADPAGQDWSCDVIDGDEAYRDLTVISEATWTSFPPTAGIARIQLGNGAVAGRQYDCDGRSVVNAGFALARPGRKTTYFNGDPDDTLPQPGLTFTNTRGTYADLDTPPGANGLVAVAWEAGELKLVGYDRFFVLPNTVVILNPNGRPPVITAPPY